MKVLQINAIYRKGSTGRTVLETHEYLKQNDIKSFVACADNNGDKEIFLIGTKLEKKFHALLSRLLGKQGYFSKKGTIQLLKYIDSIEPDIVHLRNLHSNYINLPMLLEYLAKKDIATVLTLHDCWFYTGKCVHYYVNNCFRWQKKCGSCPRLKQDNVSYFFDRTEEVLCEKQKLYNAIPRLGVIGVSDWIVEQARNSVLNCASILQRIYNWIDLEIFKPNANIKLENTETTILAVAMGWKREKGLADILEVSKYLKDDERMVLIGEVPRNVVIPPNITHIKSTSDPLELVSYYQKATVFLNLSWMESFGKVSAEALACGTPVICYNTTASPELVGNGCGYVVEKGDIRGVYEKIQMIKENKDMYCQQCVEFAKLNFDKNKNLEELMSFYRELSNL